MRSIFIGRESLLRAGWRAIRTGWSLPLAHLKRKFLSPEIIVGITGSAGKSTTTRILAQICSSQYETHTSQGINTAKGIKRRFLAAPWKVNAWIQEVSGHSKIEIDVSLDFLRPKIGIVTNIEMDHRKELGTLEDTRDNKQKLVKCLPKNGAAVLNLDDDLVASMARATDANVITFGTHKDADIRLTSVDYNEDDQMKLTVGIDGEQYHFVTQFVGQRWCVSILGAIAAAKYLQMDIDIIAAGIAATEPELYKDSVHHADGITFVLDCFKAPYWTIPSSFEIVDQMEANRKIVLIGTLSDYRGATRTKYTNAIRGALEVADIVVTYGFHARRAHRIFDDYPGRIFPFEKFTDLHRFLNTMLREGDLLYIKASDIDHLARIWHNRVKPISCHLNDCKKIYSCNRCRKLFRDRKKFPSKLAHKLP